MNIVTSNPKIYATETSTPAHDLPHRRTAGGSARSYRGGAKSLVNPGRNPQPVATRGRRAGFLPWYSRRSVLVVLFLLLFCALVGTRVASAQADAVSVTLDDAGVSIEPGDDILYTIQAINASSMITAEAVALTVTTPVEVAFADCTIQAPFTGLCTPLPTGASIVLTETLTPTSTATITMRVNTSVALTDSVTTTVRLSATEQVSQTLLSAGPVSETTDVRLPSLQLSLGDGLEATSPGAELTYRLVAVNSGAGVARNVNLSFDMPTFVTYVGASGGGALAEPGRTSVVWPTAEIASGSSMTQTVTVQVSNPLTTGTRLDARAGVTLTGAAPVFAAPVFATDVTAVIASAVNARVWRDLDGNGVLNGSESGLAGIAVRFEANGGRSYTRTTDVDGVAGLTGVPGANYAVSIDAASLPAPFLTTFESDGTPDNAIDVVATPGPVQTVSFGFAAPARIADSFLAVDFDGDGQRSTSDPGLAGVSVIVRWAGRDNEFDTEDDTLGTTMTDAVGRYAFSGLVPGRYRVSVDASTIPPGYLLRGEADQTVDGSTLVILTDSQVAVERNFYYATVDLRVEKQTELADVVPGVQVPYRITYTNRGVVPAQQVRIVEIVPDNTRFDVTTSTEGWMCEDPAAAGARCEFEVGSLAPGVSDSIFFSVFVADNMPAGVNHITNTVQIADAAGAAPDPTPLDNQAVDVTPVLAAPDLYIKQTDGGIRIAPGQVLQYVVTYGNQGNQDATKVTISQVVPNNTVFRTEGSTPGWDCPDGSVEGTVCMFHVGQVVAQTEDEIVFTLDIAPTMPVNVLTIDAVINITDGSGFSSSDAELTPVDSAPDLQLEKRAEDGLLEPGGILRFYLTFNNYGNQDAIGVVLVESVPEYTTFNPVESSLGWTCQEQGQAGDNCVYMVGGLPASDSGEVVFAVRVDLLLPPDLEQIGSTAVIAGSGVERDILNNEASGTAPITRPTVVDLESFTLEETNGGILLEWSTSVERNSWGFLIRRSTDEQWQHGQDITPRVIESVGNESSGSSYAFLDENALPGVTYYYWLQELDRQGATSIYGPISGKIFAPSGGTPGTSVFIPLVSTQSAEALQDQP